MSGLWSEYQQDERVITGVPSPRHPTKNTQLNSSVITLHDKETDEPPIFEKQNLMFKETAAIVSVVSSNKVLVIGLLSNKIRRYYLDTPELDDTLDIPSNVGEDRIYNIFLDPSGKHCLVSMASGEIYYAFTGKGIKMCPKAKLKCEQIESVAWNQNKQSDVDSKEILIGTKSGTIVETKLNPSTDKALVTYSRTLYTLDNCEPVTGLAFFHENNDPKLRTIVLACTASRIYQFFGVLNFNDQSKFSSVFSNYTNDIPIFIDNIPASGQMRILYKYPMPRSIGWMTGAGILYCKLSTDSDAFNEGNIISEKKLIELDNKGFPLDFGISEFHLHLLYMNGFEARSLINHRPVHYEPLKSPGGGSFLGLAMDPTNPLICFSFSKQNIVRFKITKEDRNVWRMYMQLKKFEEAEVHANGDPGKLLEIYSEEGDCFFDNGHYHDAALRYADSNRSFEEITLKFIRKEEDDALKSFLKTKLDRLSFSNEPTQICMLVIWLVELYLSKISGFEKHPGDNNAELSVVRTELRDFLKSDIVCKNLKDRPVTKVINEMMASYGDTEDMIFFSELIGDIETVIMHYIHDQKYSDALRTLQKQGNKELFYRYTPILMKSIPRDTVEILKRHKGLQPHRLLPSFIHCKSFEQRDQALKYLDFCVFQMHTKDEAIHNFLLSLYVQRDEEAHLLEFLLKEGVNFDLKYALRLCMEHGKWKACCYIYTKMGLYEEAVKLALIKLGDVHEAEITAKKAQEISPDDEDMVKKLWLMIARHVVEEKEDIKKAMEFINRGDRVLKIEDVLPFFKDFFYIDDFKDAICNSLEVYNEDINQLNKDMKEATESAEKIHDDISNLKKKSCVVQAGKNCYLCNIPLLTKSFYVFPCQHMYHTSCLVNEITQYLTTRKANEVKSLYEKLMVMKGDEQTRSDKYRNCKNQLDDIIAEECLMCGEHMISTIDKPFLPIDQDEYDRLVQEWQ